MLSVTCPACGSQTLEWSDEAGACETCDYGGCADNADREPASLHLLRVWRGEYSHLGFVGEPESAKILRELKVGNAAMLADLLGVPRVGPEQDAPAGFVLTIKGRHIQLGSP